MAMKKLLSPFQSIWKVTPAIRWVNLICLYIIALLLTVGPLFYHLSGERFFLTGAVIEVLILGVVLWLNHVKMTETANVLFYLSLNVVGMGLSVFTGESIEIQLLYLFLLALIFLVFEKGSTRVFCLVIVLFRIALFQLYQRNSGMPVSITGNSNYGAIRWVLNAIALSLIVLVFCLYAIRQMQLERQTRKKSLFFQHMSHDVQSAYFSVASISAHLKYAMDNKIELRNEVVLIDRLMNASDFCGYILNDFLEFSKAETEKSAPQSCTEFDLITQIEEIIDMHSYMAKEKGIGIELRLGGALGGIIKSDRIKLNRIFLNLLSNAIKNTPSGKAIVVNLESDENQYILSVMNEGEGLPEEEVRNLFIPYERKIKDSQKRVGLGLPITKELVESLGGKINVTSILKEKTCF